MSRDGAPRAKEMVSAAMAHRVGDAAAPGSAQGPRTDRNVSRRAANGVSTPRISRAHATSLQDHLRHLRRLRHADRLGVRRVRRLSGERRPRTASPSTTATRSSLASTSTSARSKAAPTSCTPRSCAASRCGSPRTSAGRSSPRGPGFLPGLRPALARVQGDQPAAQEVRRQVPDRPDLEHRRQAAGPHAPAHPARLRPRRHRPAGPLLQAATRPTSPSARGASARRRAGCTSRRATTTTSSRA